MKELEDKEAKLAEARFESNRVPTLKKELDELRDKLKAIENTLVPRSMSSTT